MTFREKLEAVGVSPEIFIMHFDEVKPDYPVSPEAHMMTVLPEVAVELEAAESWEDAERRLSQLPDELLLEQAEVITASGDGWLGWPWQYVYAIGHAIYLRLGR